MKNVGANWADIQNKVKAGAPDTVAVNAEAISLHAQKIPSLFPEGSLTDKSKAKPDIWQKWPEFQAAAKNLENRAGTLRDQAVAKDGAAVTATVGTFGRDACGACHTPFRVPPPQQQPARAEVLAGRILDVLVSPGGRARPPGRSSPVLRLNRS